jgi:predicted O-methyltransferase YrrM
MRCTLAISGNLGLESEIKNLCQRIDKEGREHWWIAKDVAEAFESAGYHLLPRHFYTPIPDPEIVSKLDFEAESYPFREGQFSEKTALQFLNTIASYAGELEKNFPWDGSSKTGYKWDNFFFTGIDASSLYTFIRTEKPKRIVEIGSGFSTHVALQAVSENGFGNIVCIEPYPTPTLLKLSKEIEILQEKVQSIPLDMFSSLEPGDILFIDSAHVSCLASDVNYELFQILPTLKKGVLVHIHDIFLPFEYPRDWLVDRRWYWNEQYLLYALLRMSDAFQVLMPNVYLRKRHSKAIQEALPFLGQQALSGCSIWLKKTS